MIEACIKMMLKASKDEIDIKHRIGRYEIVRTIGQGTFAKVKLGRHVETGEHVAIKIIKKDKVLKGEKMNQIKREISIMKLMKHPHVVQLYEVMASKSKIYLVMEYLPGGELSDIITYQTRLEEQEARAYFQQLIFGLEYCHSRGVCHRDLKPQNLLLDSHGNLKVADFGLSALPDQARQDGLLHTSCGTTTYAAPELLLNRGYDGAKADLWSCGVILFVLLAGYVPFNVQNISNLQRIISGKFKCPSWFSPIVKHILHRLLEPDPNKRITIHELKESDWFKNGISKKPHIGVEKNRMDMLDVLELKEREPKPAFLNAFELITMCPGLNLSGLFEQGKELKHHCSRFTSKLSAAEVITKLEEVARVWGLKMKRREGEIQMQGTQLAVLAQVFQVAPCLLLVELRKAEGDELEYEKFYHQKLRPILNDMVWAWTNF